MKGSHIVQEGTGWLICVTPAGGRPLISGLRKLMYPAGKASCPGGSIREKIDLAGVSEGHYHVRGLGHSDDGDNDCRQYEWGVLSEGRSSATSILHS